MLSGRCKVFEIDLLADPGLQQDKAAAEPEDPERAFEEELADRLASRGGAMPTQIVPTIETQVSGAGKVRGVTRLVWIAILAGGILAGYTQRDLLRPYLDPLLPRSMRSTPAAAIETPVPRAVRIASRFLATLPGEASLAYLEAGSGLLLYRMQGDLTAEALASLNSSVEGFRIGDNLEAIAGERSAWLGVVSYTDPGQGHDPAAAGPDYDDFFSALRRSVSTSGAEVTRTSAGLLEPGEYVIAGKLAQVRAHLDAVAETPPPARYHRVSLLRLDGADEDRYRMRVVFNLLKDESPSPQPSSPAGTGA